MICAWCEQELHQSDRPIRLSTSQPPPRVTSVAAAAASGFASMLKAMTTAQSITIYFHPACWDNLADLLPGYSSYG